MDLSWMYDPDNILDIKKKQAQEDWLDSHTLEEIATIIDDKITDIKMRYIDVFQVRIIRKVRKIRKLFDYIRKIYVCKGRNVSI